jgi:hypothetical protein
MEQTPLLHPPFQQRTLLLLGLSPKAQIGYLSR